MKLEDLTDLERQFVDAVAAGEPFVIAAAVPPDEDNDAHDIRATVIEALIDGKFGAARVTRHGLVLAGARITGPVNLRNITFPYRLWMDHCLFIDRINLDRAAIGELSLEKSAVQSGLIANRIDVASSLFLSGLTATGHVDLNGARIGGQLSCTDAILDGGDGAALDGQGLTTRDDVFLRGMRATGLVALSGAQIGGQLDCEGAVLDGGDGAALKGQRLTTQESVFLSSVTATGLIDLTGAQIGGQLSCIDAVLDGRDGEAFDGQRLTTKESVFLRGVTATGLVDLTGVQISGQLDCEGAVLDGGDGAALKGQWLTTKADVFLRGVTATGLVDLSGAQIGGQLSCGGAVMDGGEGACLNLQEVEAAALWLTLSAGSNGYVDLNKAEVGALVVQHDGWPKSTKVMAFDIRITSLPTYQTAVQGKWLSWLETSVIWSPHLYQQIALRLKDAGHEDCAKAFYIAMRRRTRKEEHKLFLANIPEQLRDTRLNAYFFDRLGEAFRRFFDTVLERTVGYGHRPLLAAWWMAGLVLLGMTVFQQASDLALMAPTRAVIFEDIPPAEKWREGYWACQQANPDARVELVLRTAAEDACLPADYPSFIPLFYSFDLAIPLLEMQPEKNWSVSGSAPWGWVFMLYYYIHIIAGTVLTGLFLAAVTGLVKKE